MGNLGQALTKGAGAAVSGVGLDRLPETLINVLSAGVSVSVAGGRRVLAPLDPFSEPVVTYTPRHSKAGLNSNRTSNGRLDAARDATPTGADVIESRRSREEIEEVERLREEMDAIIAGACPLCEGTLADINKSYLSSRSTGGRGRGAARHAEHDLALANEEAQWAL